jgi:hypothetical protein
MRFRKKPVEIEAMQWDGSIQSADEIEKWSGKTACWADSNLETRIFIKTLEGEMRADPGDWIIKGVAGEFYPCKPDIFDKTYDRVATSGEKTIESSDELLKGSHT